MQSDNFLKMAIINLFIENGVDTFYTGGTDDTDKAFSSAVLSSSKTHKNIKLILVKPYFLNELDSNKEYYEDYYNDIFIPNSILEYIINLQYS